MQYRVFTQINQDLMQLSSGNSSLEEALEIVKKSIDKIENGTWQGKSKDAAMSMILILKEYNEKLLEIAKEELKIKSQLRVESDNYMINGDIPNEWR
ncbi:hypothetical protein [Clostridium manihotivorum]|uniref:Uncharacterized protein n=1 Tax=Clostridium manihotivorum TaxID=2320868 RepID=A0A410DX18_9CLOT|nr:hypothetical protein [Clostridium manihotivorum]QAA33615.1 hypothetical protein C1I91_19330 [Clostridium manihotivorum]